ncbi:MAG: hypothetical protein WC761_00260 [Candidatus Paceibacterota bacterium]|jgi:hypothetical protein
MSSDNGNQNNPNGDDNVEALTSAEAYIGKTFATVKALYGDQNVRVSGVGDVSYMLTCDYRPMRLNVKLSGVGVKFVVETLVFGDEPHSFKKVEGSIEDAVVVGAYFG